MRGRVAPGASGNRAGRVESVDNGYVKETFYYGRFGEVIRSDRSMIKGVNGLTPVTYTTRYEYDNLGRMRKLVFPDGETLVYSYDRGGLLKGAVGRTDEATYVYVKDIAYDQFGQRVKVSYGNGTTSTYTYNSLSLTTRGT